MVIGDLPESDSHLASDRVVEGLATTSAGGGGGAGPPERPIMDDRLAGIAHRERVALQTAAFAALPSSLHTPKVAATDPERSSPYPILDPQTSRCCAIKQVESSIVRTRTSPSRLAAGSLRHTFAIRRKASKQRDVPAEIRDSGDDERSNENVVHLWQAT
jgi:hypothetical protein